MPNIFNNVKSRAIGTSPTAVGGYTVPAATQTTVIGLTVANILAQSVKVSVSIYDGTNDAYLLKNADVVPGQSHSVVGGDQKLVLNVGESIRVVSDTASAIDAIMSKLEIS